MTELREAALRYGELGLRIFPLVWHGYPDPSRVPGTPLVKWKADATSDLAQIRRWWEKWPKAGIGLACGDLTADRKTLFVLDIDEHDPAESGSEALSELEDRFGALPEGPTVLTAGGGTHRYLKTSRDVTNARGALPKGIDVRGSGGYVVVPPSTHKSGGRHQWEVEHDLGEVAIPDAPEWLLEILEDVPERNPSASGSVTKPGKLLDDRPGTEWQSRTLWSELLEADGWQFFGTGGDGEEQWTRPGKDPRDGPSATVNYGGADRLVVHSTNANVPPDSYSRLGYLAAARFGGDFSAAAKSVAPVAPTAPPANVDPVTGEILAEHDADHDGELDDGDDWAPVDVAEIARQIRAGEYEPEVPEILEVEKGKPLFYYGRSNLFGSPGGGKTWIALAAIAAELREGNRVLMVDYEDSAAGTAERLVRLGVTDTELELLDYRSVATSLQYGYPTLDPDVEYRLIVLDSTGEALAAAGINPNDDGEVAGFMALVKRLTLRKGSPGVLLLDHVPKSSDNPHGAPIGSQRKLAAATGAAYRCDTKVSPAKGKRGRLRLITAKDRLGHRAKGSVGAEIDVSDSADGSAIVLSFHLSEAQEAAIEGKPFRPTHIMQEVSQYLEENTSGESKNAIEKALPRSSAHVRVAVERLVEEGYVRTHDLGGRLGIQHYTTRPFREGVPDGDNVGETVDNSVSSSTSSTSSPARLDEEGSITSSRSSTSSPSSLYRRGEETSEREILDGTDEPEELPLVSPDTDTPEEGYTWL